MHHARPGPRHVVLVALAVLLTLAGSPQGPPDRPIPEAIPKLRRDLNLAMGPG